MFEVAAVLLKNTHKNSDTINAMVCAHKKHGKPANPRGNNFSIVINQIPRCIIDQKSRVNENSN